LLFKLILDILVSKVNSKKYIRYISR